MATFSFRKEEDDIEAPQTIPEDWYKAEIKEEPVLKANNVLKEALGRDPEPGDEEALSVIAENPKAGFNMVVDLNTISEMPEANGRFFRLHLPYPSEFDEDRYDAIGQKVYDSKMSRIIDFTKAFGGSVDGETVTLLPGLKGQVYIGLGTMKGRDDLINSIDPFAGFKPFDAAGNDDDISF